MKKGRKCASCRAGEIDFPADFLVRGTIPRDGSRRLPYRAWLCREHLEMLEEDGAKLEIIDRSPEEWKKWADETTRRHTAFDLFAELCQRHRNPTLRCFEGAWRLRHMFEQATGRKAYS